MSRLNGSHQLEAGRFGRVAGDNAIEADVKTVKVVEVHKRGDNFVVVDRAVTVDVSGYKSETGDEVVVQIINQAICALRERDGGDKPI